MKVIYASALLPLTSIQLMRLNGVGVELTAQLENKLRHSALRIVHIADIPGWLLLAGPYGELELLFAVPGNMRQLVFHGHCTVAMETD